MIQRQIVRKCNFDCQIAMDAVECLELIEEADSIPDLVLLDLHMARRARRPSALSPAPPWLCHPYVCPTRIYAARICCYWWLQHGRCMPMSARA